MRYLSILLLSCIGSAASAEPLYFRCDCNWWKALPEYQLQQVGNTQLYRTEIEIRNASFPINFKLVDKDFTPGTNYGYRSLSDKNIKLGRVFKAQPNAIEQHFEFKPPSPGTYQIFLDLDGETPLVFISKAI
ncbi:hypothetical protein ACFSJ3_02590 [Corallincola platygyrae]|uniref:Uncharacterized protein n=1 Tax=Corallincola platygyrae TaxID=1193278 RepID=A0ABW4XJK8_9GAMM